jgi:hypothetical protein
MKRVQAKASILTALVTLLLSLSALSWSQTGTSAVRGTVTDPQSRLVAGAEVTLTNLANGASRTMKTNESGGYNFDLITPGEYRLDVVAKGFKKQTVDNVRALIGKASEATVQLEVGAASEVVEVQASSAGFLINTQDASLGNNFVSAQITQLPLEARNIIDLLSLQPGATREGYVTGARADQSNVTLDGVDINNAQTGNAEIPRTTNQLVVGSLDNDRGNITTGPVLRLNSEAIEEFRVTTANGSANQGRSSGAQVNLVTKAGSNQLHGSGFDFYRTRGFEANDWFNNHAQPPFGPVDRPPLVRHTFGAGIGGPIVKDKVFFFYSYEGSRDAAAQPVTRVVPLPNLGQGIINYQYCTNANCDSIASASLAVTPGSPGPYAVAGIDQTVLDTFTAASNKYQANDTSQGDGLNTLGFRFNAPTPIQLNSHIAKFDFNLTSKQTAFLRVNVIHDHQTLPQWLPGTTSPKIWSHPRGIAAGHTWTIGDNWVNNLRYGFTRQAFTQGGDSTGNDIDFRFVFQNTGEQHTLQRVTPVHNITDDISWTHRNHTLQFGTNIRKISNARVSYANAFDFATTNPSFYSGGGDHISNDFQSYLADNNLPGGGAGESLSSTTEVQNAATALIGRFSEFTNDYSYAKDQSLLPAGAPTVRNYATQAYDWYAQDTWKARPNLTLTLGLRYSLERPVYETKGFEVRPTVPLGTYFADRLAAAAQGENFTDPIVLQISGPANGGKPLYNWDKKNFQPRVAFAWQPAGASGKSVLRGGFNLASDYYGQALAVDFDLNTTLGFSSNFTTPANTYDTRAAADLAPAFTGFDQDIRSFHGVQAFSLSQPTDFGERIEQSVDSNLRAPKHYIWNLTYERQMPWGLVLSASYVGRKAQHLLARRDVVGFNDARDPASGVDWYHAATILEKQRQQGVDTNAIATQPYFENLFPGVSSPTGNLATTMNSAFGLGTDPNDCDANGNAGPNEGFDPNWSNTQVFYAMQSRTPFNCAAFFSGNDWTDTQALVDQVLDSVGAPTRFMQAQYGALSAWSTVGNSTYHGFTFSARQRLRDLTVDFNYTWSHSLDDASGIQGESAYASSAFITNPIRQRDFYGTSDFDVKHNINGSVIWQMPIGKGKALLGNASRAVDAIVGGWQIVSIFRWNTGLPVASPYDDARWATNWNVQAYVTPTTPVHTCPDHPVNGAPKLFGTGCDLTAIYQGFRNAYPGETGPRNVFRLPGYVDLDMGLGKTWKMPWSENQTLQLRADVFNVSNTQHFGAIDTSRTGFGVVRDPALRGSTPPANWSNFTQIQGQPRVMQVGARFVF